MSNGKMLGIALALSVMALILSVIALICAFTITS